MTEKESRVDEAVARMLRAYEGPAEPQPWPRGSRGRQPVRRALLVAAALVAFGVAGAATVLVGADERRPAAVGGGADCEELRALGRRYVARRIPAGALAPGEPLPAAGVVLVCDGRRVSDAEVTRAVGIQADLALVRPGERALVYVAAGRCREAATATALVACLHKESPTP